MALTENDSPLKILIYEPYAFKIYGNLKYVLGLIRLLISQGMNPSLCVPLDGDLAQAVRALGVPVHILPFSPSMNKFGGTIKQLKIWEYPALLFSFFLYQIKIYKLVKQSSFDLVQTQNVRGMLTVGFGCFLARIPRIVYIKGEIRNPVLDLMAILLSTKVVVQSVKLIKNTSGFIRYFLKEKILVVPNGVDVNEPSIISTQSKIVNSDAMYQRFVCVSQLYPPKGIDLLLDVFLEILSVHPNIELLVIGDAGAPQFEEYESSVRSRVESFEFQGKVKFYGYHPTPPLLFEPSDIFVLPSFSEGMPRSVLEAMACGIPVIATRVGAVEDLIEDRTSGLLILPRSKEQLKRAMLCVLEDTASAKKLGQAARKRIYEYFTLERNVKDSIEIYRLVANG